MGFGRLFPLLMTMIAISVSALLSESYLNSYNRIKVAADAVLWGNIVSLILSVILGYSIFQRHSELSVYAFRGGISTKNFFGANMLIVFIGNYLMELKKSKTSQKLIILISASLLLFSYSRGTLIMLIVFLISMHINIIRRVARRQRNLFTVMLILLCIVIFNILFQKVALNSSTYMMRIKGFQNYINNSDTDFASLLIGNAKKLYVNNINYVAQFKLLYGWDGSVEFALLDILIKNGIVGLVGYLLIFYTMLHTFIISANWEYKSIGIAITVMFLISMLVEGFIISIHSPVGIYCYLVMGGIAGMCNRKTTEKSANII